ncbi:Hypothetical protein PHPALM_16322, partial [Phytophthora palmivora]
EVRVASANSVVDLVPAISLASGLERTALLLAKQVVVVQILEAMADWVGSMELVVLDLVDLVEQAILAGLELVRSVDLVVIS